MYDKIVLGTDGSERSRRALDHAVGLCQATGATLHLVQGLGSPVVMAGTEGAIAAASIADEGTISEVAHHLEEFVAPIRELGVSVEIHVRPQAGARAILTLAEEIDADLIVVGNRGMTSASRFILGSVPNSISHHAPCSVLIVDTRDPE
ncbi:MAG: universal stress protein [Acidimicrobiales bacterium]